MPLLTSPPLPTPTSPQDWWRAAGDRHVDGVPWSTQATNYPMWLVEKAPRLAEPDDIEEGTTRYLAGLGVGQVGYFDDISTRMPTPDEARLLQVGAGVLVLVWVRTG